MAFESYNTMKADLFILNYNGESFIEESVASFLNAIGNSNHSCRLTVIDNESKDRSVEMIRKKFSNIPILPMTNRVLCSFNEAAKKSDAEIVFLLNNDLKADAQFIDPVIDVFRKHEDAFLVASKSFLYDGSYEGGLSIPTMRFGFFGTTCRFHGCEERKNQFGITFSAGFGAFHRRRFLELGGYDDLYLPGRLEDADLTFRAWKKGWKCYYEPQSVLYHMGGKSFKERFGERGTMEIAHRNTFLFMWKNITANSYWAKHYLFLIPRILGLLLRGRAEFLTGFAKALGRFSNALRRRDEEKTKQYQLSDQEVFSIFSHGR